MNIVRDIRSLSIFKRDASKIIKQIKATKEPVVLTVNGKAEVVVQDAESYQELVDARDRAEIVGVLRQRLSEYDRKQKGVSLETVFRELAAQHEIDLEDR